MIVIERNPQPILEQWNRGIALARLRAVRWCVLAADLSILSILILKGIGL